MKKYLFLLFCILFIKIGKANPTEYFADTSSFKIVANRLFFDVSYSSTDIEKKCKALIIPEAKVIGSLNCNLADFLYFEVIIDIHSDGKTDYFASNDLNHEWQGKWIFDYKDSIFSAYIPPELKTGYIIKLPPFLLDHIDVDHTIIWSATDLCGDRSTSVSTFRTIDKVIPKAFCLNSNTLLFPQSYPPRVEISAKDFNKYSTDNCTAESGLYFTFDGVAPLKNILNLEHYFKDGPQGSVLAKYDEFVNGNAYKWSPSGNTSSVLLTSTGIKDIKLSVWDEAWNSDYCFSPVEIITGDPGFSVKGVVKSLKNIPIESAVIKFDADVVEFPKFKTSDKSGNYLYVLPPGMSYSISGSYVGKNGQRVDFSDYQVLEKHLNHSRPFVEYWQYIAADVNKDRKVDIHDLDLLKNYIRQNISQWVVFHNKENLSVENWYDYNQIYQNSSSESGFGSLLILNFTAVKLGDIDGSVFENPVKKQQLNDKKNIPYQEWRNHYIKYGTDQIYVIPNPVSSVAEINFSLQYSQRIHLNIYGLEGKLVYSSYSDGYWGINKIILDAAIFPSTGIYFCSIQGVYENRLGKINVIH